MKIWLLLKKEFQIEFRSGQTAVQIGCMSILMCCIAGIGMSGAFLEPSHMTRLFPGLLWMIFLFSATISLSRSFDVELAFGAGEGLLFAGVHPWRIYVAKFLHHFLLIFIGHCISLFLLSSLMGVRIGPYVLDLMVLSVPVITAYAALGTLLVGISGSSRLRSLMFPIVMLPLLFPLFLGAIELTGELMVRGSLEWTSPWFSLLLLLDAIYFVLGMNLYSYVVSE